MKRDKQKRRKNNLSKLEQHCKKHDKDIDSIHKKEKYGRFDLNGIGTDEFMDGLREIEAESENMCMKCGRTSRQLRWEKGWVVHYCWLHYIQRRMHYLKLRIINVFR